MVVSLRYVDLVNVVVWCCFPPSLCSRCCHDVSWRETRRAGVGVRGAGRQPGLDATSLHHVSEKTKSLSSISVMHHDPGGRSAQVKKLRTDAQAHPWGPSFYISFTYVSDMLSQRGRRSTLTRYNLGHTLPQVQSVAHTSAFGVRFRKCAVVKLDVDPPQLTFFLLIHTNGSNLSQVAIRDSISGIIPLKTEGRVVEKGYQTFAIDSLSAGSQVVVNYTAQMRSHKNELMDLPAFLTFSNASQNDVSMFGPLTANLTLRVNSTDRIYPNHAVHFAGFVVGFLVTMMLLLFGFVAMNMITSRTRLNLLRQRRNRGDSDPEYADCNISETVKDEAAFEDKMVDIMVLEDPQNMYQALENLEMSTLLRATSNLETTRIQIYKDVMSSLLGGLKTQGRASSQVQQRLLSVLHGQLQGMEGRLKEERGARMAALAAHCNLETREEMEAEHCREAAEKAQAELLCEHADQRELLQCSVLLEKLHKLSQTRLQRILLVRHEEASAKVQRQIIEWRRVELHKIFAEELEEATRMGELEKSTAKSLQHDYFTCQDQLEEVLDVILANQRCVLSERQAQRKFLLHSLHSLNSLISDIFSSTSRNLDTWFIHIRRGSSVPAEKIDQLQEKAQKDVVMVRQRLEETLGQERRAMRCSLIKKRRELISEMLSRHKQRQKDLSSLSKGLEGRIKVAQHLKCWQDILTAHSLEVAELINNLDEEATADIRKVTMRVIQGAIAEVKAIQPSAAQAVLSLLPPGAQGSLLQVEPEPGPGSGANSHLQGQERLHQEGKAALQTLSCTRDALQDAMEREVQEQREQRECCRAFFRCLCSSQLTLSEDDGLRMKLEFQKCLSVMDRCLVLPYAVSRTKLHTALAAWRKDNEKQMMNSPVKSDSKQKAEPPDVLLFQRKLKDRIQLFEREREMESGFMNKVLEEMRKEREDHLCSQANNVAMQMAAIHYQKAERRCKVLETSRAMVTLHSMLIQVLREKKNLETQDVAQSIQSYCLGLEEADQKLQKEKTRLDDLEMSQANVGSSKAFGEDSDDGENVTDEVCQLQLGCRMESILQEALYKCGQFITLLAERLLETTANNQATEDLKEQMELKRLYANCDQDLEFASQLVKQNQMSSEFLVELLRLLLPTLPESELLSITDALCRKQQPSSSSAELDQPGCSVGSNRRLAVRLRDDVVHKTLRSCTVDGESLHGRMKTLMEKLLPRSFLLAPGEEAPVLVEEKPRTRLHQSTSQQSDPGEQRVNKAADESGTSVRVSPAAGGRLFVFRDAQESRDSVDVPKRKKKRNFLNLKSGSVAPTNLPGD